MVHYYLFIVSSLNHPIYRQIQKKRRYLLDRYQIPYTVLINEKESPMDDRTVDTLLPLEYDEILYPIEASVPTMTQKFLSGVRQYFRSFPSENDIPNFIVRINATVYIHFPKLKEQMEGLPHTRMIAGPMYAEDSFIVGMLMIFSKDVLLNILKDPAIYDKDIMSGPDDVVLTHLGRKYGQTYNIMDHFVYPNESTLDRDGLYNLNAIEPHRHQKWYFRLCDWGSGRSTDLKNWDRLVGYFESERKPDHGKKIWWIILILIIFIGGIILMIYR